MHDFPTLPEPRDSPRSKDSPLDEGNLCVKCGICCRGSLFNRVKVSDVESVVLRESAVPIVESDSKLYFRQPCAALDGCKCTIYEDRPKVCKDYRCKLLKLGEKAEVDFEEASEIVDVTKSQMTYLLNELQEFYHDDLDAYGNQNLRNLLGRYRKTIARQIRTQGNESVDERTASLCRCILEYLQGVKKYFRSTSLLKIFQTLLERLPKD